MKRVFLAILCCVLLIGSIPVASFAAMGGGEIAVPLYNNTLMVNSRFSINSSGVATVTIMYVGKAGVTTGATIVTKVEKQNANGSWSIVDIDTEDDVWVDVTTTISLSTTHTVTVPRGTYRAVINYTISGTGGAADTVEDIIEYTY